MYKGTPNPLALRQGPYTRGGLSPLHLGGAFIISQFLSILWNLSLSCIIQTLIYFYTLP